MSKTTDKGILEQLREWLTEQHDQQREILLSAGGAEYAAARERHSIYHAVRDHLDTLEKEQEHMAGVSKIKQPKQQRFGVMDMNSYKRLTAEEIKAANLYMTCDGDLVRFEPYEDEGKIVPYTREPRDLMIVDLSITEVVKWKD